MLSDIYDVLSLSLLSIKVESLDVTLNVTSRGCWERMTSRELLDKLQSLLLDDFQVKDQTSSSTHTKDLNICNQELRRVQNRAAQFVHVCCHRTHDDGKVVCNDVTSDPWLEVLFAAVLIIKVLVVLYSPSFLPESVYHHQTSYMQYVYHEEMKLKMLATVRPQVYQSQKEKMKIVRMCKLQDMPRLLGMVSLWQHDRVYDVHIRDVHLAVKIRKLLGENHVPVNLFRVLYNNLFLCRLRRLTPLDACCRTPLFGTFRLKLTWYRCMRAVARLLLMAILVLPWLIRLAIYYHYEKPVEEKKAQAISEAGMTIPFTGSFILYLSPVHAAFLVCYIILCLDTILYSVLSPMTIEQMKVIILRCLHDMRETSKTPLFTWLLAFICKPFTYLGVLFLPLLPIFLLLSLPILIPLLAFYIFPAVNLTCRILFQVFFVVCPSGLTGGVRRLLVRMSGWIGQHLQLQKAGKEGTDSTDSFPTTRLITKDGVMQILTAIIFLVTFWSLTFLLMELLAFGVEMAVYTFIGLILTSDVTTQYLSIIFFLVLYGHGCISEVNSKYLAYHKLVQQQLLSMVRTEIEVIAKKVELAQENTALHVQGDMAPEPSVPTVTLEVHKGYPVWETSGMLLFLDQKDTPFTPEKFFEQTIDLHYCGCPGPLHVNAIKGLWRFTRIVVFLAFVFVVVMAFGSAYRVSTTNQLLATVAGGFIPFAFTYFFESKETDSSVDAESVQFRTQLHTAINEFRQTWPVFDIVQSTQEPDSDSGRSSTPANLPAISNQSCSTIEATSQKSSERLDDVGWGDGELHIIFDLSKGDDSAAASTDWDAIGSQSMLGHGDIEEGEDDGPDGNSAKNHRSTMIESDDRLV
ncbi:hypothetical protein C0Q70_14668 [Pomacea canaliculata]|uniref:Uncharacterized protein n=2 Tax=Pomacea canaliculata TaxID=400727 RepID=A0A2T7NSR4_POMCA|nr:hypothetical protein C0Q70_14668 [Pomacea canaliculata]